MKSPVWMNDFAHRPTSFGKKKHMKKPIIIYGLIAGAIVSAMMLITMPLYNSGSLSHDYGELTGYTTMVIALSVIFFAIKSYRDKQPDGAITFWRGVQIGLLITLIAGVMYALTWEFIFADYGEAYIQKFVESHMTDLKAEGMSDVDIQKERDEMAKLFELYKNPAIRFAMTIMEILPVGVIITVLASALFRRKEFLPATEPAQL